MNILTWLAGVWMAALSLFGVVQNQTATTTPSVVSTTSSIVQNVLSKVESATTSALPSNLSAVSGTLGLPATGSPWQTVLPLGDYKYVTSDPKQGYIYLCHVEPGGEGAKGTPTWISGSVWYPSEKVAVEGSVSWPNATYSMKINGSTRLITSNGLPTDHPTGIFPIQSSDPAYQFDANPNTIEPQNYSFSLPAYPSMAAEPNCIYGEVAILNDGVPLFDGFDAEYRDAVAHETQDAWNGHPDQDGIYHDHGFEDSVMKDTPVSTVVGFAFDGYPITGGKLPDGTYLTTSDLDECHGITSAITLDGKIMTTYHYVLTQDFPYSIGCFRGTSYEAKPGAPAGGESGGQQGSQQGSGQQGSTQGQQGGSPPAAAISACSSATSGSSCSFSTPNGTISGACETPPGQSSLACIPNQ